MRSWFNILITGTPGTGKTTLCEALSHQLHGWRVLNIGTVVQEENLHDEYDTEFQAFVPNEDRLLDYLESVVGDEAHYDSETAPQGFLIDYHHSDLFPERWIDLVVVLRTRTEVLYDRLTGRGYEGLKLENNMNSEIHCVCLDEATSSYKEEIVIVFENNNTLQDLDHITQTVLRRIFAVTDRQA